MFWGDRCRNVVDPNGYMWMIGPHNAEPATKEKKKNILEQMQQMQNASSSLSAA